jgi:hypothetical protein
MLKQIEGSRAVAEAVAMCRPQVICAYPTTPQTHIVEALSAMVKKEELAAELLNVDHARFARAGGARHRRSQPGIPGRGDRGNPGTGPSWRGESVLETGARVPDLSEGRRADRRDESTA